MKLPIYMDHHATTPVDPRVTETMLPFFTDKFGNVASTHCFGREVRNPCAIARKQVAHLIGADAQEIVFTSGATESNNLAIKGMAYGLQKIGRHIITCVTEHKAVLDTCAFLETQGFAVTYLPVDRHGMVKPAQVEAAIRQGAEGTTDRTILVSFMGANNEIGSFHPIREIGAICRRFDLAFHIDGAQCVGKVPFNVDDVNADLVSISAHKIYGPKGVGALYVRNESRTDCMPQMHGGGQENGLRAGTLATALIVGLGKACEICDAEMNQETVHLLKLRNKLEHGLAQNLKNFRVNGHPSEKLPGNLNLSFSDVDGELLMLGLKDIALSSTSACSSVSSKPSHVLTALGLDAETAFSSVRFGLGRFNTEEEVDFVIEKVTATVTKLLAKSKKKELSSQSGLIQNL